MARRVQRSTHRLAILLASLALCGAGCPPRESPEGGGSGGSGSYRGSMRDLVIAISAYGKGIRPGCIVVAQNGLELLTSNGEPDGQGAERYAAALDGVGQEHPFYGETDYDIATPAASRDWYVAFMDLAERRGLEVLATDYCSTPGKVNDSYAQSAARGYISFAADGADYGLDTIPPFPAPPFNAHDGDVTTLRQARNFLYLIDTGRFATGDAFVSAVGDTDYDVLITDPCHDGETPFTPAQVSQMKRKAHGGARLVLAYVNIGAAENWRHYWEEGWRVGAPPWLAAPYEDWPGEYWVRYWDPAWHTILYGSPGSPVDRIMGAGFDGVYLDNILAYETFEES